MQREDGKVTHYRYMLTHSPCPYCHTLLPIREGGAALEIFLSGWLTTGIGLFENTIFLFTIAIMSQLLASEASPMRPSGSSTSIAVSSLSSCSAGGCESCLWRTARGLLRLTSFPSSL